MTSPEATKSTLDRDDDDIREWYDRIMKGESVLVDIGTCAFSDVTATGLKHGLLSPLNPIRPPREIIDVVHLFRLRLSQPNSDETVWFNQVGRTLGYRQDELFCRRCVELPRYFEVLQFHRNKRAHRGAEVTKASLCALAGVVLGILELSADEWTDPEQLRDEAEKALAWASWASDHASRVDPQDGVRLRKKEAELAQLKMELRELQAKGPQSRTVHTVPNSDPDIVKGALTNAKAHITKKVNEAKDEVERRLEQIGDAIASLRSEVLDAQEHGQPVGGEETDAGGAPSRHRPTLTGAQAEAKLAMAFRRMRDTHGVDISANVFQRWIVEEALDCAAYGKMDRIEDWWNLPTVQRKTEGEQTHMRRQLQMPDVERWMMDIYRRVERRSEGM